MKFSLRIKLSVSYLLVAVTSVVLAMMLTNMFLTATLENMSTKTRRKETAKLSQRKPAVSGRRKMEHGNGGSHRCQRA